MTQDITYHDILQSNTAEELTHNTFWRIRHRYADRFSWMALPANPAPGIDRPRTSNRLLEAIDISTGPILLPELFYRIDGEEWQNSRFCILYDVPRERAIEIATGLEYRSLMFAGRGAEQSVGIIDLLTKSTHELGRDELGCLDAASSLKSYLRDAWNLPEEKDFDSYLFGHPQNHISAYLHAKISRDEVHNRVRRELS